MPKHRTQVSHQRLLELLSYDPETGEFTRLVQKGAAFPAGSKTGHNLSSQGYRHVGIDGVNYKAHRLAWFYVNGVWPEADIDHINGIRHDNRLSNLRPASRGENVMNSKRRSDGTQKYRGVCFHKGTKQWIVSYRGKYVGIRRTEEEAHALYLAHLAKLEETFPVPQHPAHESIAA